MLRTSLCTSGVEAETLPVRFTSVVILPSDVAFEVDEMFCGGTNGSVLAMASRMANVI